MNTIRSEYDELKKELESAVNRINEYPKGYLRVRTIKNGTYYYLQYREGKQVKSVYIRPEEVEFTQKQIRERNELKKTINTLKGKIKKYENVLGIHGLYRPVAKVDYEDYTLFMSTVAHDYKSLDYDTFIEKYNVSKYRGLNKRYLAGFYDYINGINNANTRRTNDIVLDPYTYLMYFKYGDKEVLTEELKKAIPAFLNRGLLITNIQEAVGGSLD